MVLDLDTGASVFVGDGKGESALKPFWKWLRASRAKIVAVAVDLSPAYSLAILRNLHDATLVFDRFHLVKLLNEHLTKLRRELQSEAETQLQKSVLKGSCGDLDAVGRVILVVGFGEAINGLRNYLLGQQPHREYFHSREHGWPIGTGQMESSCEQLLGMRLNGPGMHWCKAGGLAITALKATHFSGRWHSFWKNLTLST